MKINSFELEESQKMNKKNTSRETNLSMPNSKVDLIVDRNGKFDNDDYLKKISETNYKENSTTINFPKTIELNLNKNICENLEDEDNSYNIVSNFSKKGKTNENFIECKKIKTNEVSQKENIDYDFLSLSDIDFHSERDFRFIGFMSRKKLDLKSDFDMGHIFNYDSATESIIMIIEGKKVKVRLFLQANRLTAFNFLTDFKSMNAKFFPIANLDFDFIRANIFIDVEKSIFRIMTFGNDVYFSFSIANKASFQTIANKVNFLIQNSKGYKNAILSVALRKEFYKVIINVINNLNLLSFII